MLLHLSLSLREARSAPHRSESSLRPCRVTARTRWFMSCQAAAALKVLPRYGRPSLALLELLRRFNGFRRRCRSWRDSYEEHPGAACQPTKEDLLTRRGDAPPPPHQSVSFRSESG